VKFAGVRIPRYQLILVFSILILVAAACGGDDPEVSESDIEVDESVSYTVDFDNSDDFEIGEFGEDGQLNIQDGRYWVQSNNMGGPSYLWGSSNWEDAEQPYPKLKNVVVEVDTITTAGPDDNWFGAICRLDESGAGYAFLISADGFWSIARTDGNSLFFISDWRQSDAIDTGRDANNHIRAFCLNDYLALYVNNEFVGDYTDDDERRAIDQVGSVGLMAGGPEDASVVVSFDNLVVSSAQLEDAPNTPVPATETPEPTATIEPLETLPPLDIPPLEGATEEPVLDITPPGVPQ
jgi:hypothetical protein